MEANAEWSSCRAAGAATACRDALPIALRARNHRLANDLQGLLLLAHTFGLTPVDEAEQELRKVLDTSRGVVRIEAVAEIALGRLAATRGDFVVARELVRKGREALKEAGLRTSHAGTSQAFAQIETLAEDHEAAAQILREGFDELNELGEHSFASTNAVFVAEALQKLGRDQEAARWLTRARELSPAGDVATLATADYVEALLVSRTGDHGRATQLARRAVAQAKATDFWGLRGPAHEALARVLAASGRADEAHAAQREAIGSYESKGATVPAEQARRLLTEL